jgi:Fe2+ transport system protein B
MKHQTADRGIKTPNKQFNIEKIEGQPIVALAGNPNTGKRTLFNSLTGLKQHTGNWPGKTVLQAQGTFTHRDKTFTLVDLPGTYSLLANSSEEEVARDFLCFAQPDACIVVTDATCLERNLNLVLQVLEITSRVIVCVNLLDEARRKGFQIDLPALAKELGVPVVGTVARTGTGINQLLDTVYAIATGSLLPTPCQILYSPAIEAAAAKLANNLSGEITTYLNPRWLALRLMDGDQSLIAAINRYLTDFTPPTAELPAPVFKASLEKYALG